MGNNVQSCEPTLTRVNYFPGNPIEGNLKIVTTNEVEYYGIRVAICGIAWYKWSSGSGKNRRTVTSDNVFSKTVITVTGDSEEVAARQQNKYKLGKGEFNYKFSAVLAPSTLPSAAVSCGSIQAKIKWEIRALVDCAGRMDQAGSFIFNVFAPVPLQKWQMPSPASIQQDFPVQGCCHCLPCCDYGKVNACLQLDKSCVSLDRDVINFTIRIDNTQSSESIKAVNAILRCAVTPKIGATHLRPSQIFSTERIPVSIAAGTTDQVTGTIKLAPGAPPTITSAVADYKWSLVCTLDEEGCTTINPQVPVDIELWHTVDDTGAAQYIFQQQQAFQPIMTADQLNQRGVFEVPNMSMQNSPAFNQVPPPPPPPGGQMPPWGMPASNNTAYGGGYTPPPPPPQGYSVEMNTYNNNGANMATGVPPPPTSGPATGMPFPGFAQFPDATYFQEAQKSGVYDAKV